MRCTVVGMSDASDLPASSVSDGDAHEDYYEAVCWDSKCTVSIKPFKASARRARLMAQAGVRCATCGGIVEIRQDIDQRGTRVLITND